MERLWKVVAGALAGLVLVGVVALVPGAALADNSVVSIGATAGGAGSTPDYFRGNAQGDGSGQ